MRCRSRERRLARKHFVRHCAQREDVGTPVDYAVARGLLRTHIARRPDHHPGRGQSLQTRRIRRQRTRDAEIRDQGVSVYQQDILRRDVAMHDATTMREIEGTCDFACDSQRVVDLESSFAGQTTTQRFPVHVRHDVVQPSVGGARIEERQNVRVLQGRHATTPNLSAQVIAVGER